MYFPAPWDAWDDVDDAALVDFDPPVKLAESVDPNSVFPGVTVVALVPLLITSAPVGPSEYVVPLITVDEPESSVFPSGRITPPLLAVAYGNSVGIAVFESGTV